MSLDHKSINQSTKVFAVYIEQRYNKAHEVGFELIGKAKEIAKKQVNQCTH